MSLWSFSYIYMNYLFCMTTASEKSFQIVSEHFHPQIFSAIYWSKLLDCYQIVCCFMNKTSTLLPWILPMFIKYRVPGEEE